MSTGFLSQSADSFAVHPRQPRRLAHATALAEMCQNREAGLLRQLGAEQRRAFSFAEALPADVATEQSLTILAVMSTNIEIAGIALATHPAAGVQTTEA